ncbi:hypothetical protein M0R72_20645 [Candidatus Pacearchaeota archaeon]|nr:hypothetical protein [Candidatus Pacearchaeota archaeon]
MRLSIIMLTIIALTGIAFSQDFVKVDGVTRLSDTSPDVFEAGFFQDGWTFDSTAYSLTASQTAFLKDNASDGKPLGNATKHAYIGMTPRPT